MKLLAKKAPPTPITLYEINKAIKSESTKADWRKHITFEYHDFFDLFDEKLAQVLPLHRPYDHSIPLLDGKEPLFGPVYDMSCQELIVLKKYIKENLLKEFIRASS